MSKRIAHSRKGHKMSGFEIFVIEGNVKSDELAKDGAMMDGGKMAQMRASFCAANKSKSPRGVAVCVDTKHTHAQLSACSSVEYCATRSAFISLELSFCSVQCSALQRVWSHRSVASGKASSRAGQRTPSCCTPLSILEPSV